MKAILIIICIFIFGCSSVTEPEEKPISTTIVYHSGELINNIVVYYVDYIDGAEWSDYKPAGRISKEPWDNKDHSFVDKWVTADENFQWQDRWWYCVTVDTFYITLKIRSL